MTTDSGTARRLEPTTRGREDLDPTSIQPRTRRRSNSWNVCIRICIEANIQPARYHKTRTCSPQGVQRRIPYEQRVASEMIAVLVAEPTHEELERVRDIAPTARNTAGGGALLRELVEICSAVNNGVDPSELRGQIVRSQIVRKPAIQSRTRIWRALRHRYFAPECEWCLRCLTEAASGGSSSPGFVSLAYLYFALRDQLTFKFVTDVVWHKWNQQSTVIDRGDFLAFLEETDRNHPHVRKWKESTRKKLAGNTLAALRDFGLLKGARKRMIHRPAVSPEAVFHLLCILSAEGLEGRAVLEAPDWRLFLWSTADVARSFSELSQRGWIRFEKAGRTVILQLIRQPGEVE